MAFLTPLKEARAQGDSILRADAAEAMAGHKARHSASAARANRTECFGEPQSLSSSPPVSCSSRAEGQHLYLPGLVEVLHAEIQRHIGAERTFDGLCHGK